MEARAEQPGRRLSSPASLPARSRSCATSSAAKMPRVARAILENTPKAASELMIKVLKSACCKRREQLRAWTPKSSMYPKTTYANPGPILKRMHAAVPQGRMYRINKRTSHITIVVAEKE
jgi:large subunit ribosomal protein L22